MTTGVRMVKRGQRKLEPYEGYWKCLGCESVYEVTKEAKGSVSYRDGGQFEHGTLDAHCDVCGGTTAWHRTTPPVARDSSAWSAWKEHG